MVERYVRGAVGGGFFLAVCMHGARWIYSANVILEIVESHSAWMPIATTICNRNLLADRCIRNNLFGAVGHLQAAADPISHT